MIKRATPSAPAAPRISHFPLALSLGHAPAQVRPRGKIVLWVLPVWESGVFGRRYQSPDSAEGSETDRTH